MAEEHVDFFYRQCTPAAFQVALDQKWAEMRENFVNYVCYYGVRDSQHREFFTGAAQKMIDGEMTVEDVLFFLDMCLILVHPAYLLMNHLPLKFVFWFRYKRLRDEYFVLRAIQTHFIQWQRAEQAGDNKIPIWW